MTKALILASLKEIEKPLIRDLLKAPKEYQLDKLNPNLRKKAPGQGLFLSNVNFDRYLFDQSTTVAPVGE
jgi:hypothetical protein